MINEIVWVFKGWFRCRSVGAFSTVVIRSGHELQSESRRSVLTRPVLNRNQRPSQPDCLIATFNGVRDAVRTQNANHHNDNSALAKEVWLAFDQVLSLRNSALRGLARRGLGVRGHGMQAQEPLLEHRALGHPGGGGGPRWRGVNRGVACHAISPFGR